VLYLDGSMKLDGSMARAPVIAASCVIVHSPALGVQVLTAEPRRLCTGGRCHVCAVCRRSYGSRWLDVMRSGIGLAALLCINELLKHPTH
jgi:hypothetical protein